MKLTELGPRLTLEIFKVEQGVNEGDVLYHKFVHKTPAEAAKIKAKVHNACSEYIHRMSFSFVCSILTLYALLFFQIEKSKRLKEDRKATQEANVKRKREAEAEKRQAKIDRKRRKIEGANGEQEGGVDSDSGSDNEGGDVDDDDENQYGEYDGIENDGEYSGEEDDDSDQE